MNYLTIGYKVEKVLLEEIKFRYKIKFFLYFEVMCIQCVLLLTMKKSFVCVPVHMFMYAKKIKVC